MMRADVIAYLERAGAVPFAWGVSDCVQLAAGMVELARGVPSMLPAYSSELEAKRALVALGGLERAVSAALGPMQRDRRLCVDGDIVLAAFEGQQALGVAVPRVFYLRRNGGGLIPVDMTLAIGFWPCRSS